MGKKGKKKGRSSVSSRDERQGRGGALTRWKGLDKSKEALVTAGSGEEFLPAGWAGARRAPRASQSGAALVDLMWQGGHPDEVLLLDTALRPSPIEVIEGATLLIHAAHYCIPLLRRYIRLLSRAAVGAAVGAAGDAASETATEGGGAGAVADEAGDEGGRDLWNVPEPDLCLAVLGAMLDPQDNAAAWHTSYTLLHALCDVPARPMGAAGNTNDNDDNDDDDDDDAERAACLEDLLRAYEVRAERSGMAALDGPNMALQLATWKEVRME
jgi:hypothetical protein